MFKKVLIFLIKIYQLLISPVLGNNCRYYPCCSNYAIEALNKKPLLVAVFMIVKRLIRCNPWSKGGYDPVKL